MEKLSLSLVKKKIPWWIKIIAGVILSNLPIEYETWTSIGLFQHGNMQQPKYAYEVFKKHYDKASLWVELNNFAVLELGPGDSLFTALTAFAFGANRCYLVDTSSYAISNLELYRNMANFLVKQGKRIPNLYKINTFDKLLFLLNTNYGTMGLKSLLNLPDKSVDFIISHAVLEHVRKSDFFETMQQLRRIIRENGICSHTIDLKDHLGGNLDNLRFSEKLWELDFIANSSFYTNRIRYSEMMDLFQQAGFDVEVLNIKHWDKLPTLKKKFSRKYRKLSNEELLISGFDVILHPV